MISSNVEDPTFFVLPDITAQLSALENETELTDEQRLEKKDARDDQLCHQKRTCAYHQPTVEGIHHVREDDEYVVIDGQVKIVMSRRDVSWKDVVILTVCTKPSKPKEGVKVEAATQTFATITLQNYFRMYHKLSGMTGTAETEAGELWDIYKLDVVVIPTNRPIARNDMNDRVYKTKREKYKAVIEEIEKMVAAGRPVLVGTTSVEII